MSLRTLERPKPQAYVAEDSLPQQIDGERDLVWRRRRFGVFIGQEAVRHRHDVQAAVVLERLEAVHEVLGALKYERCPIGMAAVVSIIVESTLDARRRGVSLRLCVEMTQL